MKRNLNSTIFVSFLFVFYLGSSNSHAVEKNIFKGLTSIDKPFERRDPFKAPKLRVYKAKVEGKISDGNYSNIPVLGDVKVSDIAVVGVIIGKERRAFVRLRSGSSGRGPSPGGNQTQTLSTNTYTVKEGQLIGENDAELKAILPGGLILVEKTTNIYGQEEYLETVIPISK